MCFDRNCFRVKTLDSEQKADTRSSLRCFYLYTYCRVQSSAEVRLHTQPDTSGSLSSAGPTMALQARALVSTKWLADAITTRGKMRVLDSSWYLPKMGRNAKREFKARHIPGAAFFDIDQCCDKTSPLDHMLPSEKVFADYVGNLGIENDTHVVIYDRSDFGAFSAPRVWWMFRVFGHNAVSLLNGGFKNWELEGRPVSDKYIRPSPTEFKASIKRSWIKTYDDLLNNLDTKEFQVVDARSAGRFRGVDPEPRDNTEPGHIPGSASIPFQSCLSESGHFLPKENLRELFVRAGVDLSRPVCVSCGSGVTACVLALAAYKCGHPEVSVYDGAWSEWYTRAVPEHVISEGRGKHL
ncbi:PREDICTED: 3-mercaptopyruvate sulfurtransferase-like [Poecilia mexicana]|uniref:Sulfurtransferase n=1 Tax=Poecilia mexicana TaxID=48701 RepID=A0A3B3WP62_9TELE|nr:PREDICTED: 3-mercaptopyruvate sulfurtransferase-like [Poecilia mexicana]